MIQTIKALTYNMSWATQINLNAGSERNFVEECRKIYKNGGKECTCNAIKNIGKLSDLDLVGLQEVNSNLEKKIIKVQKNLKNFKRYTIPVIINKKVIGNSTISIIWNPNIFGKVKNLITFNLSDKDNDPRPCMIIHFNKNNNNYVIINLHAPQGNNNKSSKTIIESVINKQININKEFKNILNQINTKIIVLGDFNDHSTEISKNKPLKLKINNTIVKLSQQITKNNIINNLKTCCWHKRDHKYGFFTGTGDYILINNKMKIIEMKIPKEFNKTTENKYLLSDHKPVFAKIEYIL